LARYTASCVESFRNVPVHAACFRFFFVTVPVTFWYSRLGRERILTRWLGGPRKNDSFNALSRVILLGSDHYQGVITMEWTTPQHEEIDLNCEISSYANAEL
jgi:hypothetical protein